MNIKQVVSAISYSAVLALTISSITSNWALAVPVSVLASDMIITQSILTTGKMRISNLKESKQETIITFSLDELKQDCFLKIIADKSVKLRGDIKINGKLIQKITNYQTQIPICQLLQKGKNIVEISGSYTPNTSSIKVEFTGSNTETSQESSGNGYIQNTLIIYVE